MSISCAVLSRFVSAGSRVRSRGHAAGTRTIASIARPGSTPRKSLLSPVDRPRALGLSQGVNVMACTSIRAHIRGFPQDGSSTVEREGVEEGVDDGYYSSSSSSPALSTARIFPDAAPDPRELKNLRSEEERRRYLESCRRGEAEGMNFVADNDHEDIFGDTAATSRRAPHFTTAASSSSATDPAPSVFDGGLGSAKSVLSEACSSFLATVKTKHDALAGTASAAADATLESAGSAWKNVNPTGPVIDEREFFRRLTKILMEGDVWTFGRFLVYQREMRRLLPQMQNFLERKKQEGFFGELPAREQAVEIRQCDLVIRVLEAMTPRELQSNCRLVFSEDAKRLLAEKGGCRVHDVNLILDQHNELRGDRRWFAIRQQFGRRLPYDFQERTRMAVYDRPQTKVDEATENLLRKVGQRDARKLRPSHPKRAKTWVYRRPSVGGNRWSTQPPRWMPRRPPGGGGGKVRAV